MKLPTLLLALSLQAITGASTEDILENSAAKAIVKNSGYRGTVLIYDEALNSYTASHPKLATERFIPASTFKVMSSLCALESRIVENSGSILKWDGITRNRSELNRDLDLTTAFRVSAVPHYQQIVRTIGQVKMQQFLDSIPYGNYDQNGGIEQFWLTGSLRISPLEQINFLKRLYHDELPFASESMTAVRAMMKSPNSDDPSLSSKTGWAVLDTNRNIGWWIGWIEKENGPVFFATVIESRNPRDDFGKSRIDLTKTVLQLTYHNDEHP